MIRIAFLPTLLAATALAMPAHAADLATIGCVGERIELPVRAQIEIDVERNMTTPGVRPTYDARVTNALRLAAERCAADKGWSEAAMRSAMMYTLAKVGWPKTQAILTDHGFDTAALEQLWLSLPEEKRNAPLTAADYQALVIAAVTDEAKQTRENAELVKQFFGLLSVIQHSSFDFSQA